MSALVGKVALITGAGRGIGAACARLLAEHGATVWLTARTAAELDRVAAEIAARGGVARAIAGDITDDAFVERLFAAVEAEHGRLDILVCSAGIAPGGGVEEQTVQALRDCLELNVVAVFACIQQAVRLMNRTGGEGKIVSIGSVRSHWTEGGSGGAYNASKYALRGMVESIARQLHGSGSRIAVGLVCPGVVDTTLTNPSGAPRSEWLQDADVARAVLHAVTAPPGVNVFDTTVIPMVQRPW